jgi:DNA polymerase-3 subunit gamma/tau
MSARRFGSMADFDFTTKTPVKASGSYTVVARRYRPQTFDELIGQGHIAQALKQAISTDRVGHAYLFTGARGVGKTSAARVFAKALDCVKGPATTPCNACDICESIAAGDDVDVLEIDGASNRGIDEIRQLRQNVAVRPSRARFKIYIIDEVHMLTKEAFNALLKTLEEPPEHVKFFFATTEPNKIPITILSRCQRFDFAGIDPKSIQTRLTQIAVAEGVGIEPEAVQILASRAAGSMRDSQSLLEQLLAVADGTITAQNVNSLLGLAPADRLSRLVEHLIARDAAAALEEFDAAQDGGVEVGQFLDQLVGYFRDVMLTCVGCSANQVLYALPTQTDELARFGQKLGTHTVLAILQILDQTAARLRLSVHGRTLVEMALVRICNLEDLDDLAALLSSLQQGTPPPAISVPGSTSPRRQRQPTETGAGNTNVSTPSIGKAANAPIEQTAALVEEVTTSLAEQVAAKTAEEASGNTPLATATSTNTSAVSSGAQLRPGSLPQEHAFLAEMTVADRRELWDKITAEVGGLAAGYSAMTHGIEILGDAGLVVQFESGAAIAKDQCEQPETHQHLERVASRFCGADITLRFELADAPQAAPENATNPSQRNRRQLHAEVAEQPFVKKALNLFDVQPGQFRYVPPNRES